MESKHGPQGMFDNRIPSSIYGISFPPDGCRSTGSVAKSIIFSKHSAHLRLLSSLTDRPPSPPPTSILGFGVAFVSQLSAMIAQKRVRHASSKCRLCRLPVETNPLLRRYREISHHAPRTVTRPHTGNFVKKFSNTKHTRRSLHSLSSIG